MQALFYLFPNFKFKCVFFHQYTLYTQYLPCFVCWSCC